MEIKEARFIISNTDYEKCPRTDSPEYAFTGRSNVGKSSLINMLTGRKSLAKISGKPGKTRLINHFLINDEWYLVDLPGYGYAKIGKQERKKWEKSFRDYILFRENLHCLFVLIDSRHAPQQIDLDFMKWLGMSQIPFALIFTKTDKLKPGELEENIKMYQQRMLESWESLPSWFLSSAKTGEGRNDILNFIEKINKNP
jgi:GTP-binding protein